MLTKALLRRFVKRRNESAFQSNLQFQIDANGCGFKVDDLGPVQPFLLDRFKGYQWKPQVKEGGTVRLVEFGRMLHLSDDPASADMFELMNRAEFVPVEDKKSA